MARQASSKPAAAKGRKTPAKAASSPPATPNRERPAEPKRYQATKDELLDFYKQMLLIRRFEERAGQLYGLGLIGGFCHLYIGQEAVAVGLQSALEVGKDSVITGYRDHGHMLAYGIDPKVIMAELTGRAAGISKGKGGSMHMFSVEHRFYGGHGIVGAQVSLGTGLALKHKYSGDGGVCLEAGGRRRLVVAGREERQIEAGARFRIPAQPHGLGRRDRLSRAEPSVRVGQRRGRLVPEVAAAHRPRVGRPEGRR